MALRVAKRLSSRSVLDWGIILSWFELLFERRGRDSRGVSWLLPLHGLIYVTAVVVSGFTIRTGTGDSFAT